MKGIKKLVAVILSCLLITTAGLPINPTQADAASNKTIADVGKSHYSYQAAQWAIGKGYLTLDHANKFNPSTRVAEWHILKMIATMDNNYNFSIEQSMMYQYYGSLNIPLFGLTNNSKRNASISRGHFARIYAAMNGLDLSEPQAVQYLYLNEITSGTTGKRTYEDFKPNQNITRSDLAVFMYRIYQQGAIALDGLPDKATGKDNSKITLPKNFIASNSGSVNIPLKPGTSTNDKEKRPDIYKAVKSIDVESETLIANGLDSTLISIQLKDSYGNEIPFDESLQFKVTSLAGATFSETGSITSGKTTTVFTDGPELNVFVTAPALTQSVVDTIRFEMVNPTDQYYTYRNQVIEASVRYLPKAELRISYEVFDPDQIDWAAPKPDQGPKPLPALPQGIADGGSTVNFTEKGIVTITDYDADTKLFSGYKWETYTNATTGQLTQGNVESEEIQYGNAELKLDGQLISVWLFERILANIIYGDEFETDWNGQGSAKVMYTINNEGRATYDLQGVVDNEITDRYESTIQSTIIYLLADYNLPKVDDLTLAHEESVLAIKALYDRLSSIDKNRLQELDSDRIGKLEGAVSKINVLKKGAELQQRPDGMERYTKVIVNVVAPSGVILTDYRGTVEIEYNGKTKLVSFDTNTKDYNTGTGSAGSAVAFFDDLLYGYSTVSAKLVDKDPRYTKVLGSIETAKTSKKIFTNEKFTFDSCGKGEIAFLVDHSGSIKKYDKDNHVAVKTKQMIRAAGVDPTHVYRFSNQARFEAKDAAQPVANIQSLLQYQKENSSTELVKSAQTVINNFSPANTSKVLVIITDGNAKKSGLENLIKAANAKGVTIHTISMGKYNKVNEGLLKQLANETNNGTYFNVTDVNNIHGPLQSILKSLCGGNLDTGASCVTVDALFNEGYVKKTATMVNMQARINESCTNVAKVIVVFTANSGSQTFELRSANNGVYKLSRTIKQFKQFNLYREVEMEAYDAAGNLIATKEVSL